MYSRWLSLESKPKYQEKSLTTILWSGISYWRWKPTKPDKSQLPPCNKLGWPHAQLDMGRMFNAAFTSTNWTQLESKVWHHSEHVICLAYFKKTWHAAEDKPCSAQLWSSAERGLHFFPKWRRVNAISCTQPKLNIEDFVSVGGPLGYKLTWSMHDLTSSAFDCTTVMLTHHYKPSVSLFHCKSCWDYYILLHSFLVCVCLTELHVPRVKRRLKKSMTKFLRWRSQSMI